MSRLDLVVPGLLGPFSSEMPAYVGESFRQPAFLELNKWLSRAETSKLSADNYVDTLLSFFNLQADISVCALTANYDDIDVSEGYFYRADPVHFKAESDHAILIGTQLLSPTMDESGQLINAFNQHFAEDRIRLHAGDEGRWYLQCDKALDLQFHALDYALGRDIKHFMPKGKDELWWRRIVNEAQMLFFQHAVNEQRELNRQLSINGLWLWDFSAKSAALANDARTPTSVFADEGLAVALCKHFNLPLKAVNEFTQQQTDVADGLVIIDQLYESVCYGDINAWMEEMRVFCETVVEYVGTILRDKRVDEVIIYPCDGQVIRFNRWQLQKFWKKMKTIDQFILLADDVDAG